MAPTAHTPLPRSRASSLPTTERPSFHADRPYDLATTSDHSQLKHVAAPASKSSHRGSGGDGDTKLPERMHRQDSGYASIDPRSPSLSRTSTRRQSSFTNPARASSSSNHVNRVGTATRRPSKAGLATRPPISSKRSRPTHNTSAPALYSYGNNSTYHEPFPRARAPSGGVDAEPPVSVEMDKETTEEEAYPSPPQTTHYWTSDQTRRLEYAAIDAASQGFKGWMLRHVVPECFVPKDLLRPAFEDETGSVRRYRLELATDDLASKAGEHCPDVVETSEKKKGWRDDDETDEDLTFAFRI
ncbi:hypothetical protein CMQ_2427 [Grosmannia clavigera kw1407]|uniref:Uncharacterized protein n=1 Tax=Grosmannia clavigera (strain kw1407 / UAMH 11150) TaxID=655863 RepID=F0XJV4_GROCL|nr:uncharacterized protein CMQ_2427 [Grosmannia clavigera kw1407]EFX02378.1 hypothetical protein CMQ_2427 [Grosmannia clavigera kw1407]